MKKLFVFFSMVFPLLALAQQGKNTVLLTQYITYRVNTSDYKNYKEFGEKLFDVLTDTNQIYNYSCYKDNPFIENFYNYTDNKSKPFDKQELYKRIYFGRYNFSTRVPDTLYFPKDQWRNFRNDTTQLFYFGESWEYDTVNINFIKKVNFISPGVKDYDNDFALKGYDPIFCIVMKQPFESDTLLRLNNAIYDVKINYDWFPGAMNTIENIEPTERLTFLKFIFSGIYKGQIKAYNDSAGISPVESIRKKMKYLPDRWIHSGGQLDTIIEIEYNIEIEDINKIRFIEDWVFDNTHQCFVKKVKAMGFIADPEENNLGDDHEFVDKHNKNPLFWIIFEK